MMTSASYNTVYQRFLELQAAHNMTGIPVVDNLLFPNALDIFILKLFDCYPSLPNYPRHGEHGDAVNTFTRKLATDVIDIDWLFGEHAVALLKAKMIQRGMING